MANKHSELVHTPANSATYTHENRMCVRRHESVPVNTQLDSIDVQIDCRKLLQLSRIVLIAVSGEEIVSVLTNSLNSTFALRFAFDDVMESY